MPNKREDNLMTIGYMLSKGNCQKISCRAIRNDTINKFPCPFITQDDPNSLHLKCISRFDRTLMMEKIKNWMEENNITKGDVFPYLF